MVKSRFNYEVLKVITYTCSKCNISILTDTGSQPCPRCAQKMKIVSKGGFDVTGTTGNDGHTGSAGDADYPGNQEK
jgi:hypothetical protein